MAPAHRRWFNAAMSIVLSGLIELDVQSVSEPLT
jgi:hypothetical protein